MEKLDRLMHRFPDLAPDLARAYLGGPAAWTPARDHFEYDPNPSLPPLTHNEAYDEEEPWKPCTRCGADLEDHWYRLCTACRSTVTGPPSVIAN